MPGARSEAHPVLRYDCTTLAAVKSSVAKRTTLNFLLSNREQGGTVKVFGVSGLLLREGAFEARRERRRCNRRRSLPVERRNARRPRRNVL